MRLTDLGWRWIQARWNALPLTFLSQMASGALAAASLTALCLQPAAHSTVPSVESRAASERSLLGVAASEAPVPLEALLQFQTPRQALLWTPPSTANTRPAAPALPARNVTPRPDPREIPTPSPTIAPNDPQQHGGLDPSVRPG
jgi:hypothetical protein